MIDPESETLLDAKAATRRPEFRVNGRAPHFSTIWRWMLSGKLENVKIGGKRVTSVEAIHRMIARGNPSAVARSSPRQREAELSRLEKQLAEAGV